ncbi:MAG: hypothetical protein K2V38_04225 [Gemmataceae bacterium]|nr:hypothetical protein [Gemmataceae bacterium]
MAFVIPRRVAGALCAALCAVLTGCGKPDYELAEVEGVVRVKGHTGAKIRVEFYPDPDKGVKGPTAVGETDDEGRFRLTVVNPKTQETQPGAVVGWHRVVLSDLRLAESETGRGVPVRFGSEYASVLSTPLTREVKAGGKQTIEIDAPGK